MAYRTKYRGKYFKRFNNRPSDKFKRLPNGHIKGLIYIFNHYGKRPFEIRILRKEIKASRWADPGAEKTFYYDTWTYNKGYRRPYKGTEVKDGKKKYEIFKAM